ncbi:PepSY domain-containing protein [Nocardioides sp. NPDC051685]|uniref:PepSY domain-containing protein n=1 Tax=Nocardioides sp. NPDC051685 TaxID=3364334 RepID=UPI0037B25BB4
MNTNPTRKRIAVVLAASAVVTAGTVGAARALSGDDDTHEQPIPTSERDRAEQAALEETGGGTVTGTEVDDEESKYEVEVTLDNGHQVDVQLDESFQVVGTDGDDDSGSDD